MGWRRSKSLVKLVSQINAAYPSRDTTADGAIGDADHATRDSDHNPWVKDGSMGVVTAQDIDEDLDSTTHSLDKIIAAICASRDPRVKYIIYEGRITVKGSKLQQWKKYTGKNAHRQHAHISVFPEKKFYDDDSDWEIGIAKPAVIPATAEPRQEPQSDPLPEVPAVSEPVKLAVENPQVEAPSFQATSFTAFVPQIDTAKNWLKGFFGTSVIGTAAAMATGMPVWLQIGLFSLVGLVIIGAVVMFVRYHKEIFAYVTSMNTLRATEGVHDPVLSAETPKR